MNALAYLRHPIALLVAVCAIIGLVWYLLGLPSPMPPSPLAAGEKLACVAYAPEAAGDVPASRIESDLKRLEPFTSCVRTFRTGGGMDHVATVAEELGLHVLQGIELGHAAERNRQEIERAMAIARAHARTVRAFVAGSDVLAHRALRASELAALIREIREHTGRPVTTAEQAEYWLDADILVGAVDFVMLHVPLYDAYFPISANDAANHLRAVYAAAADALDGKRIEFVEAGWPSAGRMREASLPSAANQVRVLHELLAAARAGKFQLSIFEGIDQTGRAKVLGTSADHWGLIAADGHEPKFQWGRAVIERPLWFMQGVIGVLFALVIFAAAFLAARSAGPAAPAQVRWTPVALIALAGSLLIGWAVAELPVQSYSPGTWAYGSALLALAIAVPPVCAAAAVREVPLQGFALLLDPVARRAARPLARAVAAALTLVVFLAVPLALVLAVDPDGRDFPFAALIGPALSFLVLSLHATEERGLNAEGVAEAGAALVLAVCAVAIVFNESFWNWQALWVAAALLALAWACWRAGAARMPA